MLRYEQRAMFDPRGGADPRIIVHGVNCQGTMGAGFAKLVKEKYPSAFNDYAKYVKDHSYVPHEAASNTLLGQICVSNVSPSKIKGHLQSYVIHAFTQEHYGRKAKTRYVSYDAIDDAMKNIASWYKDLNDSTTIGMPMIGSGFGGGDWDTIEAIIKHRLNTISVLVYDPI